MSPPLLAGDEVRLPFEVVLSGHECVLKLDHEHLPARVIVPGQHFEGVQRIEKQAIVPFEVR